MQMCPPFGVDSVPRGAQKLMKTRGWAEGGTRKEDRNSCKRTAKQVYKYIKMGPESSQPPIGPRDGAVLVMRSVVSEVRNSCGSRYSKLFGTVQDAVCRECSLHSFDAQLGTGRLVAHAFDDLRFRWSKVRPITD